MEIVIAAGVTAGLELLVIIAKTLQSKAPSQELDKQLEVATVAAEAALTSLRVTLAENDAKIDAKLRGL